MTDTVGGFTMSLSRPTFEGMVSDERWWKLQNIGWRARDVSKAQLLVRDTNPNAVSFYEHLGFESAPRVVMGKWLNKLNPS